MNFRLKKMLTTCMLCVYPVACFADFFIINDSSEKVPGTMEILTDHQNVIRLTNANNNLVDDNLFLLRKLENYSCPGISQRISESVMFRSGGTQFNVKEPATATLLRDLASKASMIVIVGYTDSTGNHTNNQRVALRRAESARQFFQSYGIDPKKISTSQNAGSYVADNKTVAGRAANRRVVIHFYP